ncbi:MAG: bifunctional diaminohydroxyphosphoribosylaminopyrimidine deaminase/5-amino-6-(5-phosphoribosylamino)uracil reductase RibD [Burkholderiales bacterium]|nr:bifunctional diaminohydroxyphosphoribosylaminopyrimidine deaminase/5-amino-6-(5-phosphoribosylamino)uracil reductase RibD [Burkholderiales bacterium]MDE1926666.1 bifunctional diaminohydroxyphosphoribosylaminopyrimidine deaminase/5-amino-6-(5-phosphoribosylamino)uracil reductase RibD [Burkholderiales bacterium]MDE2160005.1 bifunctional diaminohydroxyphosphoribosylaminopyrimidine deaminase/5-amino-6-(5-phosphoribosylamino)uracil reductase RibD [Burkholderiales bacterium]MDE2503953.1 bifunctiona
MPTALDSQRLTDALTLAASAIGVSDPNPRVGCVIGHADGRVLGTGATQAAGQAHAEVMALRAAQAAGHDVRGATAWVTLEPCAHHGRTPPCCDALIAAGIARVVVAAADPYPEVDGRGIARLRAAGVEVELACGPAAEAARELNLGFFSRVVRGRPWVRMKIAASLDGRTALANGVSRWITGAAARADGHAWRRRAGAVLTGIGTALHDDPRLDVREVATALQPLRVVVDSRLRLPPTARLLHPPDRGVIVVGAVDAAARRAALAAAGAEVLLLPDAAGRVDLGALLTLLAQRGVNELHVEAGAALNAALLAGDWVDELLVYLAPKLVGPGLPLAALAPRTDLDALPPWRWIETAAVGDDLRLRLRPPGRADF